MDDLLQRIVSSEDPAGPLSEAVRDGANLQLLNQNIFSSLFSTYVADRPADWNARTVETALQILREQKGDRSSRDRLLEIAFHGNLALLGGQSFYRNISRIELSLQQLERQGVTRSSQYVRGLLAYARDDLTMAERAFKGLPNLHDTPLLAYQASYPAFRAPAFYGTLINYEPPIQLDFIQRPRRSEEAGTVFLCSADDLYFMAFADEFAAQIFAASPTSHIHFHLVNNSVESSRLIQSEVLTDDRVSLSAERTNLPKPDWYAIMARYIILPLVMLEWRRPVIVTDIDLLVRSDPADLNVEAPVILGFSDNPAAAYIPSTTVLGGHNLFKPDEAGLAFAQLLSRYLHYVCMDRRGVWVADQVALLMVWRMLKQVMPIGNFCDIRSYGYGPPPDRPGKKKAAEEWLKLNGAMR